MANESLGDAYVRLGVDLGSLSGDLSRADSQVKAAFKSIIDNLNGIKIGPQIFDQAAMDKAFDLFQKISKQLNSLGLNGAQAAGEMAKLAASFQYIEERSKSLAATDAKASRDRALFASEQLRQQESAYLAELRIQEAVKRTTQAEQEKRQAIDNSARSSGAATFINDLKAQEDAYRRLAIAEQEAATQQKKLVDAQQAGRVRVEVNAQKQGAALAFSDIQAQEAAYQRLIETEERLDKQNQKVAISSQQVFSGLRTAGLTLTAAITVPLLEATKDAVQFGGQMERLERTLTRSTGSADVAKSALKSLVHESLESPFDLKVLVEGQRRLTAFGFSAQTAANYLHTLGDATAAVGGNSGTLDRLVKAIGDIKQKGVLTGEEIRQLGNAPLGAVKIISEELGISTEKVLAGVKAKAISADEAIAILMKGINDKFGGEQKRQSEDTLGQIHKLQTEYQLTMAEIGKAINPMTKEVAGFFATTLEGGRELAKTLADLPTPVKGVLFAFTGLAGAIGPFLATAGQAGLAISGLKLGMEALGGASVVGGVALLTGAWAALAIAITGGAIALNSFAKEQLRTGGNFALPNDPSVGNGDPGFRPTQTAGNFAQTQIDRLHVDTSISANSDFLNLDKLPRFDPMRELRKKLAAAGGGDAERERSRLFSNAGLPDVATDYRRTAEAVDTLWNSLTRIQQTQATERLEERLRNLGKEGVLSAEQVQAAYEKLEARLDKAGGPVNVVKPKLFVDPNPVATEASKIRAQEAKKSLDDLLKIQIEYQANLQAEKAVKAGSTDANDLFRASQLKVFEGREEELAQIDAGMAKHEQEKKSLKEVADSWTKLSDAIGVSNTPSDQVLIDSVSKTFKDFGINDASKSISSLTASYKFLIDVRTLGIKVGDQELVSAGDLDKAWYRLAQTRLSNGEKLTAQEEAAYIRIQRQISGVSRLQATYRQLGGVVSSVFDGLIRDTVDLLIPQAGTKAKQPLVPDNITSSFAEAFSNIAAKGYSDPKKALIEITNAIKNAGTTAQANAIAIKNFGAQGPVIANLLRTGQLSVEQITYAIDKGSDTLGKMAASESEVGKQSSILDNLWRNLAKGGLTVFAKAIESLIVQQLKPLLTHLGEILAKLPVIGGALGKIFGAGGTASSVPIPSGGGAPTAGGGSIPSMPGGLPPVEGPNGSPVGLPSGGAGGAGAAAGSALNTASQITNMITGAVSAISSVVGNFQMAHMNTALGRIEEATRRLDIATTQNGAECLFAFAKETMHNTSFIHDRLIEIGNKLIDPVTITLEAIETVLKGMGRLSEGSPQLAPASGGDTYNFYLNGTQASSSPNDPEVRDAAQRLTTLLRQRGTRRGHAV